MAKRDRKKQPLAALNLSHLLDGGIVTNQSIVPLETVESRILFIRGEKVMIDADLAALYGVTTKRLNEQVKRNRERFPHDFMFQLTAAEKAEVVANCDHLRRLKFSPNLPFAFTEHGAIMLATVLNSPKIVNSETKREFLLEFCTKN